MIDFKSFNTQPHEGGCFDIFVQFYNISVSTHSRTKAAAPSCPIRRSKICWFQHTAARRRLRSPIYDVNKATISFNTQPHEGGCQIPGYLHDTQCRFNTQPHEGGCQSAGAEEGKKLCFNTQPHEGGCMVVGCLSVDQCLFQHTAARRRLQALAKTILPKKRFQHTAARRRLPQMTDANAQKVYVSTHSRTKAAASCKWAFYLAR